MENNENLVTEEVVAENVEQTTEETQAVEKTYTQAEVDDIVGKAKYRAKAQVKKDYDRKYGNLKSVLKAGTGIDDVEELTNTFKEHYAQRGVEFPTEPTYSKRDIEVLAKVDADEIIKAGFDEVIEEADRLNELGVEKMSERDKALFVALTNHIKSTETGRELSKIGVSEDVYNSKEFNDFASKFNSNTPIKEIWEIYNKTTQPKKEIKTMGSIKNNTAKDNELKDFYTPEEAMRFTVKDFDDNPRLLAIVEESMKKWKK
jgi:hypothetical protein